MSKGMSHLSLELIFQNCHTRWNCVLKLLLAYSMVQCMIQKRHTSLLNQGSVFHSSPLPSEFNKSCPSSCLDGNQTPGVGLLCFGVTRCVFDFVSSFFLHYNLLIIGTTFTFISPVFFQIVSSKERY